MKADDSAGRLSRTPSTRIAILGWGSLLWDAAPHFDAQHGPWRPDGPELPLEFSRISQRRSGALTLVIDSVHGTRCEVSYAISRRATLEEAIADLRDREATSHVNIGFLVKASQNSRARDPGAREAISAWVDRRELDAVVWTDLEANFEAQTGEPFSIAAALWYLEALDPESRAKAMEYFQKAPASVDTALRRAVDVMTR